MYQNGYGGMKAEEKSNYLNQSVFTGYIKGFSAYIPSSIKSSIKKQIMNSPVTFEEKDTIVGTFFDECYIQGEKHKILINCYNNGFQVWDLNHVDGVKEILSFRDGLTKFCKVLTNPLEPDNESSSFYGKRPLLAVVSGEDNSVTKVSRNMVRIFSLQTTELISMYKFKSPIYNVLSNQQLILVVLKERIVGFNSNDMSKIKGLSLPSFPSVTSLGVIALGSRWIAYTDYESSYSFIGSGGSSGNIGRNIGIGGNNNVGGVGGNGMMNNNGNNNNNQHSVPQNQTFGDAAVDGAVDIAKEVAQKLYYFGDIGRKKVSSYLYPEDNSVTSPNSSSGGGANLMNSSQLGSVVLNNYSGSNGNGNNDNGKPVDANCVIVVFDFVKQKIVTIIKPPHTHPISYLTFDPTGTILFTSTTEGTKVNAYQIIPFTNSLTISSPTASSANSSGVNQNGGVGGGSAIVVLNNNNNQNGGGNGGLGAGANNSGSSGSGDRVGSYDNIQSYRHIYILKRGITNASIQGISTSENSKWVALTTSRGTTHIFAINPLGGEVDIHSHIITRPNTKRPIDYYSSVLNLTPSLLTINAMDRIKLGNDNDDSTTAAINSNTTNHYGQVSMSGGNACFIDSQVANLESLFVVSPTGQLILYELRPQRPPVSSEMAENTLCLLITPVAEWDVCRKTRQPEYKSPYIPYTLSASIKLDQHLAKDSDARWLYNIELTTHSQDIRAIWGVPQFTFRSSSLSSPTTNTSSLTTTNNNGGNGGNNEQQPDINFFDQDYPTGEVIKFEKRKNISPRIQDGFGSGGGNGNYLGTSPNNGGNGNGGFNNMDNNEYKSGSSFDNPGAYFVNIKDEDDIEIIEKLNDAMKTPISKSTVPIQITNNNNNINNSSNNNRLVGPPLTTVNNNNNNGNGFNNNNNNNNNSFNSSNNNNNFNNNSPETGFMRPNFNFDNNNNGSNNNNYNSGNNLVIEKDLIPNPIIGMGSGLKYSGGNGAVSNNDINDDGGIGKFSGLGDDDDEDDFPSYPSLGANNKFSANNNKFVPPAAPIPIVAANGAGLPIKISSGAVPSTTTTTTTTTATATPSQSIPIPISKKSSSLSPTSSSSPKVDNELASSFSSSTSSPTSPKPNLSSPPKNSSKKSSRK